MNKSRSTKMNRKTILELLVWLTCITILLATYVDYKNQKKQDEFKTNRAEEFNRNTYFELDENRYTLESNISEQWNEFYAHVYINHEYLTVKDLHRQVTSISIDLERLNSMRNDGWAQLRYYENNSNMDVYTFKTLVNTYKKQNELIGYKEKLLKAYSEMVPFLKDTDTINLYDPLYFEFNRHLGQLDYGIDRMPDMYKTAMSYVETDKLKKQITSSNDSINNLGCDYIKRLEDYKIELLAEMSSQQRTKDSLHIKVYEGLQSFAKIYNKDLVEECRKMDPEKYSYMLRRRDNKVLVLLRFDFMYHIPLHQRKQLITSIENSINTLHFQEKQDYYIGVIPNPYNHLVMAISPDWKEDKGIYAHPSTLRTFFCQ